MDRQQWHAEVFAQDNGFEPYTHFIDELDDFQFTALDAAIENVLAVRGIDLVSTEWLKPLGQGLHEFRVRHTEDEILHMFGAGEIGASTKKKVLLRVFVHFHGARVVLLLSGYDKGDDPSDRRQEKAIARATQYLTEWRSQETRRKAASRKSSGETPR
jgi:putative component of toxin-antitoxin plasmid stabilization module